VTEPDRPAAAGARLELDEATRRRLRHDLRTPLTIITGFGEVLASEREIGDDDRREYATRVVDASVELRQMLDELLGF
jgi:signal transduction histidine kinase